MAAGGVGGGGGGGRGIAVVGWRGRTSGGGGSPILRLDAAHGDFRR